MGQCRANGRGGSHDIDDDYAGTIPRIEGEHLQGEYGTNIRHCKDESLLGQPLSRATLREGKHCHGQLFGTLFASIGY